MSLSDILSIARSALLIQQRAMSVTAHNIANATTPGYSRQTLNIVEEVPLLGPLGTIGRGVSDAGITRARDDFYDATYRMESGLLGGSNMLKDLLGRVEGAVNEPSDTGIAAALDNLFQSFGDLANDPTSGANRNLVVSAASRFVTQLHQLNDQLNSVTADAVEQMRSGIDSVNSIAQKIADFNKQILADGGANHSAPDLADQRDLLVDQLSGLVSVRVLNRDDGTIAVLAGDTLLVDGGTTQTMEMKQVLGGGYGMGAAGSNMTIDPGSGSLKALSDFTTVTVPGYQQQLDTFAHAVVTEVNAVHETGYNANGQTGTDFFDPNGVTAATINLTAAVQASGDAIAAGGTNAPGDNTVALQLAALAGKDVASLGGKSFREYYIGWASTVGSDNSNATQDASVHQALADQADTMRSSVSGVSVDEEMINMIGQQQAYTAAARLVTIADQVIQEMLQMVQ